MRISLCRPLNSADILLVLMTGLDSAQLCGAGRQRLTGRGAAGACVFVQERSGARRAPPGVCA